MQSLFAQALKRVCDVLLSAGLHSQFDISDGGVLRELQCTTQYNVCVCVRVCFAGLCIVLMLHVLCFAQPWSRLWSLLLFEYCHISKFDSTLAAAVPWGYISFGPIEKYIMFL